MSREIYIIITLFIGLVICVTVLCLNRTHLEWKAIVQLIFGIVFLITPTIINNLLPEKVPPDYQALHRPYLQSTLIISNHNLTKFDFSYQIQNLGKYTAKQITYISNSPDLSRCEIRSNYSRELMPGGKMSIAPNPLLSEFSQEDSFLYFELIIQYEAKIHKKEKTYISIYKYVIPTRTFKDGNYNYEYAEQMEGVMDYNQQLAVIGGTQKLERLEGTFHFRFAESEQDLKMPTNFVKTPTKLLTYNPLEKTITFKSISKNGESFSATNKLSRTPNGSHVVIVTWSEKDVSLYIDGK